MCARFDSHPLLGYEIHALTQQEHTVLKLSWLFRSNKKCWKCAGNDFDQADLTKGENKKAGNRLEMTLVKVSISQDPLETLFSERSSLSLGDML